jgi:Ni/Co efflux regulator RcnB
VRVQISVNAKHGVIDGDEDMKKFILALAGTSVALTGLAATPASAADFGRRDHGRYEQVQNRNVVRNRIVINNRFHAQQRRWQQGQRFDRRYAMNYRVIDNPYYYNLRPTPRGYRWVQSGNDAVLIAITSGIIGAVLANAF